MASTVGTVGATRAVGDKAVAMGSYHKIKIYFYGIDATSESKASENIVNRAVSYLDPPFCHCELQFMNGESLAVYANTRVSMRKRTFEDPQYQVLTVPCTPRQYDAAYTNACTFVGLPFGWMALINCKLMLYAGSSSATFCSKLCCDVLNHAKILQDAPTSDFVSPSALYTHVESELLRRTTVRNAGTHGALGVTPALDFQRFSPA